jgi:hypothetical protein
MRLKPAGTAVSFEELIGNLLACVHLLYEFRAMRDDIPELMLLRRFAWHRILPMERERPSKRKRSPCREASGMASFDANTRAELWTTRWAVVDSELAITLGVKLKIVGPLACGLNP